MKTNSINNISFGTKPLIGDNQAYSALPKYSINLTKGILDAFEKLSKNGIDDVLVINIGKNGNAKKASTDILHIHYSKDGKPLSGISFSPKTLSGKSSNKISRIIRESYDILKNSKRQDKLNSGGYSTQPAGLKISKQHKNKINQLVKIFGFDDWTCA